MSSERTNIYVNRELSWLKFNERVLEEAEDRRVPLMERLKFVAIYDSNLDEFMMIRVGSLFDNLLIKADYRDAKTGLSAEEQLDGLFRQAKILSGRLNSAYTDIIEQLKLYQVVQVDCERMDMYDQAIISKYFHDEIQPLLSPQIIDKQHPFPFFRNEELYVGVHFAEEHHQVQFGVVPVSCCFERLFVYSSADGKELRFALIEDIIIHFADKIFKKYKIESRFVMRVTRNGDLNMNEGLYDQDIDWRAEMERLLKRRKKSAAVRLQLSTALKPELLHYLCKRLEISEREVIIEGLPLDMSFVYELASRVERLNADLFFDPLPPVMPAGLTPGQSMMEELERRGDLLLAFPFHNIKPFLDLLDEAAVDPSVISIKMTLYRVAAGSKIISALIKAAENGKDVLVMVELRARFDEQNNIDWSKQLEQAGCTVIYGVEDYKVHSKLMVITRKVKGQLCYITQIGTGNYNEKTAKLYTDLSLMTTNEAIALDGLDVFQSLLLGGFVENSKHLLVAPKQLRRRVMELMDEEIKRAKAGEETQIVIKINSISDKEMIDKLLEASQAGVKITLFVRGICCFRAGVAGFSENITVKSIVGRFLEHSRIYVFGVGPRQKIYIGSADWMTRNTVYRVEVAVEVLSQPIREKLLYMLKIMDNDNVKARYMDAEGTYHRVERKPQEPMVDSQRALYQYFAQEKATVAILKEQGLSDQAEEKASFWTRLKSIWQK